MRSPQRAVRCFTRRFCVSCRSWLTMPPSPVRANLGGGATATAAALMSGADDDDDTDDDDGTATTADDDDQEMEKMEESRAGRIALTVVRHDSLTSHAHTRTHPFALASAHRRRSSASLGPHRPPFFPPPLPYPSTLFPSSVHTAPRSGLFRGSLGGGCTTRARAPPGRDAAHGDLRHRRPHRPAPAARQHPRAGRAQRHCTGLQHAQRHRGGRAHWRRGHGARCRQ